jgi:hypothetical protein
VPDAAGACWGGAKGSHIRKVALLDAVCALQLGSRVRTAGLILRPGMQIYAVIYGCCLCPVSALHM